jgi:hypothetical protein
LQLRLTQELGILIDGLSDLEAFRCRRFTVSGRPALHAVQTGKLLLLAKRFLKRFPSPRREAIVRDWTRNIANLSGSHLEVFQEREIAGTPSRPHLAWKRGADFPYDGAVLPFNHQSLWVAGLAFDSARYPIDSAAKVTATSCVRIVLEEEGLQGKALHLRRNLSDSHRYNWRYWWGRAREGWGPAESPSINTPLFSGDRDSIALARYRTFDALAVALAMQVGWIAHDRETLQYFAQGIESGNLELFLSPALVELGVPVSLSPTLLERSLRFDSAPELRNAVLAAVLLGSAQGLSHHP